MANTTYLNGNFISIELDGSTDWDMSTEVKIMNRYPGNKLKVKSISVYAADGAVIICRDVAAADQTSPKLFHFVADAGQLSMQYVFPEGVICQPAFDSGDCGAGTVCIQIAA